MAPIAKAGIASDGDIQWHELKYNGLTLKYTLGYWGAQPQQGYPLFIGLHGGGGYKLGDLGSNTSNWKEMAKYFYYKPVQALFGQDNTKPGAAYIACRGVSSFVETGELKDEYNIHSRPECYVLYQQMISNLLQKTPNELAANFTDYKGVLNPQALHFVDSNQIHLLGFSAGGDGAFNLARCLPDLFASAVPSAGYATGPDDSKSFFENFANLPTCLQVGEKDDAYFPSDQYGRSDRAKFYYYYHVAFNQLHGASRPDMYWHQIFMVKDGKHSSWFDDSWQNPDTKYECLTNLDTWIANFNDPQARVSAPYNLNAVRWASGRKRRAIPQSVVWNLGHRPEPPKLVANAVWEQKRVFYWLFDRKPSKTQGLKNTIRASYTTENNKSSIYLDEPTDYIGILLRPGMVNFQSDITVICKNPQLSKPVKVTGLDRIKQETFEARGDSALVFSAMIYFEKVGDQWNVKVADSLGAGGGEPLKGRLVPDALVNNRSLRARL